MDMKQLVYATYRGFYDSVSGMKLIFYLDKEINERKANRVSPTRVNAVRQKLNSKESIPLKHVKKNEESNVTKRIIQCSILNGGIFLMSILFFEYGLLPAINILFEYKSFKGKWVWSWMEPTLLLIFRIVWVIPLFTLSKMVNALIFQDIADSAYRHSRGRPVLTRSISKVLADSVFSIVIEFLFLLQASAFSYIPIHMVGYVLRLVQMCMLYSLYAFEYKWFNMGWELHKRLSFIEANWPYFLGFGLPMVILTEMSDSWIISGCVFSLLFPFFIISGNEATPIKYSNGYPVSFFAMVISISNIFFSKTIKRDPKKTPALGQK